jgi:hypothetical protein
MKSTRAATLVLLGVLCAALSACTDSNITAVKKASLARSDFTFGEALDDAKGCKDTAWERHDDGNGRPVGTYICTAQAFDDITQEARKKSLADLEIVTREKANAYPEMINALQQKLSAAKASGDGVSLEQKQKLEAAAKALQGYQAEVDAVMKSPINNPEWKRMAQQQLAQMQQRYEDLKAQIEKEAPANKLQTDGAIAKAQQELDNAASWEKKYADAVNATKDRVEKEISDHYGRAHVFKLRIQFPVTNKSAITPSAIEWLLDDRPVAASILMPSFLYNPKEMEASLRDIFKDKVSIDARGRYQETFPIKCYYRWSDPTTGCAVKAK